MRGSWSNKPVVIVGGGLSLRNFNYEMLNDPRLRVVAVKRAVYEMPFAECCFGLDIPWMRREAAALAAQPVPLVLAVDGSKAYPRIPGAAYLGRRTGYGLCDVPDIIHTGGFSGFGAFNYAYQKGSQIIVLLGFDSKSKFIPRGKRYEDVHYAHPRRHTYRSVSCPPWEEADKKFTEALPQIAARGMIVLNGCASSGIKCFPRMSPHEAIAAALEKQGQPGMVA